MQQAPAIPFQFATRNKRLRNLAAIAGVAGGGLGAAVVLPKTGFLARVWLNISYVMGGTVNTPNPTGIATAIRRVRLQTNQGADIFNVSGIGYGYLLQNACEIGGVNGRQPKNQYNTAVTAATFNLDMVVPVMLNLHDTLGLVMLQDEQLQIVLTVEWENQTVVGGSTATMTSSSATPMIEFFTVPPDPRSYPESLNLIQQTLEDQLTISQSSGDFPYTLPTGNAYLQLLLAYNPLVTAVDNWTRLQLRINQGDYVYDYVPQSQDQLVGYMYNLTRGLGQMYIDLMANDGLGTYGTSRDFIDSAALSDFQFVLTVSASGTLYLIRRMILPLQPAR